MSRQEGDDMLQSVAHNGQKRKHTLKFQAISTPGGLETHLAGMMEGRRHDWKLYLHSGVNEILPAFLVHMDGHAYSVYGD